MMRKFKDAFKLEEPRAYLAIIIVSVTLITVNVAPMFQSFGEAIKHSAFQVGSIITTTDTPPSIFDKWPAFSKKRSL
ncbi:MAG: hypothetical protein L6V93_04115 [Clostridiales bacterium]|nr:MAG: hypothetical protein L6V93_04115 [Clostridiales bacterium]